MKFSSAFFQNKDCEFFPCHEVKDTDNFSCLFCFCPLYHMQKCQGKPRFLNNGVKDCSDCSYPHMNYSGIIRRLAQEAGHE